MEITQIINKALEQSLSYIEYRELLDTLLEDNKTTGPVQNEDLTHYTRLNIMRMQKWDKHFELQQDTIGMLHQLENQELWLIIVEGWCGDAAHSLPVLEKFVQASPHLELRIVLRDENPSLIDRFLTNGSRSIPKLIRMDAGTHEVLDTWGPRPEEAKQLFEQMRVSGTMNEAKESLQLWYARNKGRAIEHEIAAMLAEKVV